MKMNIKSLETLSLSCVQNLWLSSATEMKDNSHQQGEPAKWLGCPENKDLENEDRRPWKTKTVENEHAKQLL